MFGDVAADVVLWFRWVLEDNRALISVGVWLAWMAERRRALANFQQTLADRARHHKALHDSTASDKPLPRWFDHLVPVPPRPPFTGVGRRRLRVIGRRREGDVAPGQRVAHYLIVGLLAQDDPHYETAVAPMAGVSRIDAYNRLARQEGWPEQENVDESDLGADDILVVRVPDDDGQSVAYVVPDPAFRTVRSYWRVSCALVRAAWEWQVRALHVLVRRFRPSSPSGR